MTGGVVRGDFSLLAADYARYRPGYAPAVVDAVLRLAGASDIVDVGAGTGIWTKLLADRSPRSLVAVEPNAAMRAWGRAATPGVRWVDGCAESTGLPDHGVDLVCMASSYHWADAARALPEFRRVLRPGGWFVAVWNPRDLEASPVDAEAELELRRRAPGFRRVSSGSSSYVAARMLEVERYPGYASAVYLEARHHTSRPPAAYEGLWRSANDVRAELGETGFDAFLAWLRERLAGVRAVDTVYLTRAWAFRVRGDA